MNNNDCNFANRLYILLCSHDGQDILYYEQKAITK